MRSTVCYLRKGRKLRATGEVLDRTNGLTKVKPSRADWSHVWLTRDEIEAGKEKPAYQPRTKRAETPDDLKPKRVKKPKPTPVPRWKQLVDRVRKCQLLGAIYMDIADAIALADELEKAQNLFQSNAEAMASADTKTPPKETTL